MRPVCDSGKELTIAINDNNENLISSALVANVRRTISIEQRSRDHQFLQVTCQTHRGPQVNSAKHGNMASKLCYGSITCQEIQNIVVYADQFLVSFPHALL